jgi:hypothetical protein
MGALKLGASFPAFAGPHPQPTECRRLPRRGGSDGLCTARMTSNHGGNGRAFVRDVSPYLRYPRRARPLGLSRWFIGRVAG